MSESWNKYDKEALADPQPGDYWNELFSWHCFVVGRDGDQVMTLSGNGQEFPRDGEPRVQTLKEFQQWLSYGNIPGTWAHCGERGVNVEGWMDDKFETKVVIIDPEADTDE